MVNPVVQEKHEVLLRLRAIELLAYWEGRLVTNRLVSWFGISRQQASSDIKKYIADYNPGSVFHDPSVKAYVTASDFKLVLTSGSINEYLNLISGMAGDSTALILQSESIFSSVQLPERSVQPEVVRTILMGCHQKKALRITYASMSNPDWHERIISPHTLIYSGFRWHVRAYCHKRKTFRDFLLSRVQGAPIIESEKGLNIEYDQSWQTNLDVTLIPNPLLTTKQQSLVAADYSMSQGRLTFNIRKALVHYTLQRYQAGFTEKQIRNPKSYPLIIDQKCKDELYDCLFD
jgi:predicted DNA-binding transcriptional regulator YafY